MNSYQQSALRTLSDQYHIGAINPDLLHAAIGIGTEAGELIEALHVGKNGVSEYDTVNLIEEMGDVMWYVAVACHALATDIATIRIEHHAGYINALVADHRGLGGIAILMASDASRIQDVLKRTIYYGAPLNTTAIIELLKHIITLIEVGCLMLSTNIEAACAINIAKLQRRFPDRFATAQAIGRDLQGERATLEAGAANG